MHVSKKDATSSLSLQTGLGYPLARRSLEDACASSRLLVVSDPCLPRPALTLRFPSLTSHRHPCSKQPEQGPGRGGGSQQPMWIAAAPISILRSHSACLANPQLLNQVQAGPRVLTLSCRLWFPTQGAAGGGWPVGWGKGGRRWELHATLPLREQEGPRPGRAQLPAPEPHPYASEHWLSLYLLRWSNIKGFPCDSAGKESISNTGDLHLIPDLGRSPGEGKGYPLQYSDLENSMDCRAHEVAKSWTPLGDFHWPNIKPGSGEGKSVRESIPRQVDKKSGVPEEEKGIWGSQSGNRDLEFSRRRKGQTSFFFFPTLLSLNHMKCFFFL